MRLASLLALASLSAGCNYVAPGRPGDTPRPEFGPADLGFGFAGDLAVTQPTFGPVVISAEPPPPVSGGTLLVLRDGKTAAVSDPERDRVYLVDLDEARVRAEVPLEKGDQPGRLVEDADGRVHVVLRAGGAIASIPAEGSAPTRRAVCPLPRGIDWDAAGKRLWVACADGQLVALPPDGGEATARHSLPRDLRDVVVAPEGVYVSLFRSARVLLVDPADGSVKWNVTAAPFESNFRKGRFSSTVAWRMTPAPGGGVLVVHQRGLETDVDVKMAGGYGGDSPCDPGIVQSVVSRFHFGEAPVSHPVLVETVLPVDVAVAPGGRDFSVAAAGNRLSPVFAQVYTRDFAMMDPGDCRPSVPVSGIKGQAVAVAYRANGSLVVQTREPAALLLRNATVPLAAGSREDSGHTIFHSTSGRGVACASCHPEGGDDAHTWRFAGLGARRTQTLRGGILSTAPFHWDGDMRDLPFLVEQVFVGRMGGPRLDGPHEDALGRFVDQIPALPGVATDAAAVARGRTLFEGTAGCASCHNGPLLTNNASSDVGTGGVFQVPMLRGVAHRAPYLHDGCGATLRDRFDPKCGGGARHGNTAGLAAADVDDLVAYLESL